MKHQKWLKAAITLSALTLVPPSCFSSSLSAGFTLENFNFTAITYTYCWTGHFAGGGDV
jgi:hypothetical protein